MSRGIPLRIQDKEKKDEPIFPEFLNNLGVDVEIVGVGFLQGGMVSGKPSVGIFLQQPNGTIHLAQLSAAMFLTLAAGMKGAMERWGEPWDGP